MIRSAFSNAGYGRQRTTALRSLAAAAAFGALAGAGAQTPGLAAMPPPVEIVYVCPFDRSIRGLEPGVCRAGNREAALNAEVPEPLEFPLTMTTVPPHLLPGEPVQLRFEVRDPWEQKVVDRFTVVHEAPFHAFIVSEDLDFFLHDHPRWTGAAFELGVTLPRDGFYRVLTDFLPEAATPQLLTRSLFVGDGRTTPRVLVRDYERKRGPNLEVQLEQLSADPVAGTGVTLRFHLTPDDGIEPYLGAAGHMLVVSDDLIDMTHTHPASPGIGSFADFRVVFPRPRVYRVWVQFQRQGVVTTAHFDVPVQPGGG